MPTTEILVLSVKEPNNHFMFFSPDAGTYSSNISLSMKNKVGKVCCFALEVIPGKCLLSMAHLHY